MRVLIAEDNGVSRLILRSHLRKWGYEVVEAVDGDAAWAVLSQPDAPRLAILDWMMPGMDGIEVCRKVREAGREPYVYVILLTGRESREDVVTGLDAGADDYVTKPFDAQELRVRVRAGERICKLQTELLAARDVLQHRATHDHLTDAWNRAAILDFLERERKIAMRTLQPLSVAMIDFDHFKKVNDVFGHLGGDEVLREGVRRIRGVVRSTDVLGRYGGEEFLLVLPGCGSEGLLQVAESVRAAIAQSPILSGESAIPASVSIGGATWDGQSASELLNLADLALYRAKRAGRDRVEVHTGGDTAGLSGAVEAALA
jgi:diguanylate cyclase (GGDEF)-like protein